MLQQNARWNGLTKDIQNEQDAEYVVQALLEQRGIWGKDAQQAFLHPSLNHIQQAEDLFQIDIAAKRIQLAIHRDEHIVIYGDYDADGITSTAVLFKALQKLDAFCDFYIPNRMTEGYGLNNEAIERLYSEGVSLIITVDNGIASVEEVAFAKSLGLDIIITDHHEIQEEIPKADAVIHPKLSNHYEFKELAGVGVAFQLATKLLGKMDETLLDLVAIGTVADLVPLLGENRVFTYYGLKQLEMTKHIGLKKLMEHCRIEKPVMEDAIGFRIGPRLNAVGRIDHAAKAVQLLVTEDEEEAAEIVLFIDQLNAERQQLVTRIVKEAEEKIIALPEEGIIMLYDESWHEGVLGIVASRIVNKYNRPTFIFNYKKEEGILKGSARSIPAFDLFTNCIEMNDQFVAFGGHAQAAGMTLSIQQLDNVWDYLNGALINQCTEEDFEKQLTITHSLNLNEITEAFVADIQSFAPFGMANEKPLFHIEGKVNQVRTIGQNNNHLKVQLINEEKKIDCIGFHKGINACYMSKYAPLELVGYLQINEWNGNRSVQLLVEDMRIQQVQMYDFRGRRQPFPLDKTLELFHTHVIIIDKERNIDGLGHEKVLTLSSESDFDQLQSIDVLYIFDLPQSIEKMTQLLRQTRPKNIFLCYDMNIQTMFEQVPTREEFKWVYGYLRQTPSALVTEKIKEVIHVQQWKQDKVVFIFQVLLDLQFIYLQERVVFVNENPEKKALHEAKAYQDKKAKQEMNQLFYQDTFDRLSKWMSKQMMENPLNQEEIVHEL